MWMGALQQQGANTFPFFDLDSSTADWKPKLIIHPRLLNG